MPVMDGRGLAACWFAGGAFISPPNLLTPLIVTHAHGTTTEYRTFWTRVQVACKRYLAGVDEQTVEDVMYGYLKEEEEEEEEEGRAGGEGGGLGLGLVLGADGESLDTSTDAGSHSVSLEFDMDMSECGEASSALDSHHHHHDEEREPPLAAPADAGMVS